jgi:D-alanine-D-alanine ligase
MEPLHVGLVFNLKHHVQVGPDAPPDALAEYDTEVTVNAIKEALEAGGHRVTLLEADETLWDALRAARPDICFNIAEGLRGDARESHVPAILEMLAIPYTGSKVLAHALSLNKAAAKRVWRDAGLPTAPFQVFDRGDEPLAPELEFPLFVKPVQEGSGMGIDEGSVVRDRPALYERVRWLIARYRQPALVEAYLPGREFTVGLVGNRLRGGERRRPGFYDAEGFHVFPVLEIDVSPVSEAGTPYSSYLKTDKALDLNYLCPAPIDAALAEQLQKLAVQAFEVLGGLDVARVDFRLDAAGRPMLMEINTLPGLNPVYSDIVIAARAGGVDYTTLINEILNLALERYGMAFAVGHPSAGRLPGDSSVAKSKPG